MRTIKRFTHVKNDDDEARFFEVGDLVEVAANGDKGYIVSMDHRSEEAVIEFTQLYGGGTGKFSFDDLTCLS